MLEVYMGKMNAQLRRYSKVALQLEREDNR